MHRRRYLATLIVVLTISASFAAGRAQAQIQQPPSVEDRDRAIDLYKRGDSAAAIHILKDFVRTHSEDADAWYFLGLAYYSESAYMFSRPAFEHLLGLRPDSADANAKLAYALILGSESEPAMKAARRAIELGDTSPEPHYAIAEANFRSGEFLKAIQEADLALQSKSDFAPALITKALSFSALKQPAEAAASLEQFLGASPDDPDAAVWREQLVALRKSSNAPASSAGTTANAQPDQDVTFSGKDVTVKVRVLEKPEPSYTEAARKAGVTGTVVLKCIFSSSGEVRNIVVMRALGFGLTSQAVQTARKIRFTPAGKDGLPVSMYMQLQYNFNLY